MRVTLTPSEMRIATFVAQMFWEEAVDEGVENRAEGRGQRPDDVLMGKLGELAAAKAFNRYPTAWGGFAAHPDVGTGLEVRSSRSGHLIVHEKDARIANGRETYFSLAIVDSPNVEVSQPISLEDVMQYRYHEIAKQRCKYGIPGWWVPKEELTW